MVGIYDENGNLLKKISSEEKSDVSLMKIIDEILNGGEFKLKKIIYANGPGSFMGMKVAYVVLKTISIVKECEFYSVSGFELNGGAPIRANKNLSFVDTPEGVKLQKAQAGEFCLPRNLGVLNLNYDTLPNYVIQAV